MRRSLPLRVKAVPLAAAGACLVLCMVLLFVANPQDQVLRAWERFQQQMKEPQEQLEALTKTLEEQKNAADVQKGGAV